MGRASRRRADSRAGIVAGGVRLEELRGVQLEPSLSAEAEAQLRPTSPTVSLFDLQRCVAERRELDLRIDEMVRALALRGVGWGQLSVAM